MTLTVASECASILVESALFNITNESNSISVKINGGTAIVLTPTASATNYTITPELLDVETFSEGVYDITLTSVLLDSSIETDQGCAPIICDLLCQDTTLAWYADTANVDKVLALEGIKAAADCETCGCAIMLTLYNSLSNDSTPSCGCGCA